MSTLQNFLLRLERELSGLLDGPWAAASDGGGEFRRTWAQRVRMADNVRELANLLVMLEGAVRKSVAVLPLSWDPQRRKLAAAVEEAAAAQQEQLQLQQLMQQQGRSSRAASSNGGLGGGQGVAWGGYGMEGPGVGRWSYGGSGQRYDGQGAYMGGGRGAWGGAPPPWGPSLPYMQQQQQQQMGMGGGPQWGPGGMQPYGGAGAPWDPWGPSGGSFGGPGGPNLPPLPPGSGRGRGRGGPGNNMGGQWWSLGGSDYEADHGRGGLGGASFGAYGPGGSAGVFPGGFPVHGGSSYGAGGLPQQQQGGYPPMGVNGGGPEVARGAPGLYPSVGPSGVAQQMLGPPGLGTAGPVGIAAGPSAAAGAAGHGAGAGSSSGLEAGGVDGVRMIGVMGRSGGLQRAGSEGSLGDAVDVPVKAVDKSEELFRVLGPAAVTPGRKGPSPPAEGAGGEGSGEPEGLEGEAGMNQETTLPAAPAAPAADGSGLGEKVAVVGNGGPSAATVEEEEGAVEREGTAAVHAGPSEETARAAALPTPAAADGEGEAVTGAATTGCDKGEHAIEAAAAAPGGVVINGTEPQDTAAAKGGAEAHGELVGAGGAAAGAGDSPSAPAGAGKVQGEGDRGVGMERESNQHQHESANDCQGQAFVKEQQKHGGSHVGAEHGSPYCNGSMEPHAKQAGANGKAAAELVLDEQHKDGELLADGAAPGDKQALGNKGPQLLQKPGPLHVEQLEQEVSLARADGSIAAVAASVRMVGGGDGNKAGSPLPKGQIVSRSPRLSQDDGGVEVPITEMSPPRNSSTPSVVPRPSPAAAPVAAVSPHHQQWQQLRGPQQEYQNQQQLQQPMIQELWPSPQQLRQPHLQSQPQKLPFQQVGSQYEQQQQHWGQARGSDGLHLHQQQLTPGRAGRELASQQQQQQGMLSSGFSPLPPSRNLPPRPPEAVGAAATGAAAAAGAAAGGGAAGDEAGGSESGRRRSTGAKATAAAAAAGGGGPGSAGPASRSSSPGAAPPATAAAEGRGTAGKEGGRERALRSRDGTGKKPGSYAEFDKDTEEEEEEVQGGSESEGEQQMWASLNLTSEGPAQEGGVHGGVIGTGFVWWRSLAQRSTGVAMLPRNMVRRLARKGGLASPGQGVRWKSGKPLPQLSPRLRWITAVQRCSSTAQLALQMRVLDNLVNWDALKRPNTEAADPEWFHASATSRRKAPEAWGGNEYLVMRPYDAGYPWGLVTTSE